MASILGTLFISLELFAVGFAFVQMFTAGGLWIAGLLIYAVWLIYIGSIKKALLNLGTGIVLAVAFLMGGLIASLVVFIALLVIGELLMKPSDVDEEEDV